jgi:Kef-type K+ transport system membrane component KefB
LLLQEYYVTYTNSCFFLEIRNSEFISFIFAPVFFASIGLKVNFETYVDFSLVLIVLSVACIFKLMDRAIGARWGVMLPREAWAVGFGMVSVGAMGIAVGRIAVNAGIIHERLYVALLMMVMLTSRMSARLCR